MGLDVSHNCWSGSYIAFNLWRNEIAKAVNIPLELMEGYCEVNEIKKLLTQGMPLFMVESFDRRIFQWLPVRWESLKSDAFHVLLNHSDCDGEIAVSDCIPLAERLEAIALLLPTERWNMPESALKFAKGLRLAASLNENVEFE